MTPPVDNLHELPCTPDADTMRRFVDTLFANVGVNGLIEVSWTSAKAPHKLDAGELFGLDQFDELVAFAAKKNSIPNCNVYVSAGLRSNGTYLHARAADVNVRRVTAVWADFDALGAMQAAHGIAEHLDIPPNLVTFTGKEPHLRGQFWWVLDEPTEDLELHRQIVGAIARRMNGDKSVVNPSRVMRFIGSVAWPLKAGRALEMTGILEGGTRAMPYTMDELAAKLTRAGCLAQPEAQVVASKPSATVLDFNNAEPTHDLDGLIRQAAEPGQWHKHALLASAHLLARGTPPDVVVEVLAARLIQPGYTYPDTRNELVVMVNGAINRGFYHPQVPEDANASLVPASPFLTIEQLAAQPAIDWLVEGYLQLIGMSALFAPSGGFKSFVALDIALSIAYGVPWHGFATKQRRVLYIVAEGSAGFYPRIRVWQEHRIEGRMTDQLVILTCPVDFLRGGCVDQLMAAVDAHLNGVGLVIIDTLARNFGEGDENLTRDMNAYVAGAARLVARGCHVMHVHHTGNGNGKRERGSSALRAALDTSMMLAAAGDLVTLTVEKQKDAEAAKPLQLSMAQVEGVNPQTGEVLQSLIPVLVAPLTRENGKGGRPASNRQQKTLKYVRANPGCTLKEIAEAVGEERIDNLRNRQIAVLRKQGLITVDSDQRYWPPAEELCE